LYDPRAIGKGPVSGTVEIDNSSSTMMTFYDQDNNVLFIGGKGEGNIRFYEVDETSKVHYLNDFKAKDPQSGLAQLPKTSCDIMKCEIMKLLKLTPTGGVVPIAFAVPRNNVGQIFQEDIFPDTFNGKPSMSSNEWFSGASKPGNTVSLKPQN